MTILATAELQTAMLQTAAPPSRMLCLLIEPATQPGRRTPGPMRRLDVSEGVSWLSVDGDGLPVLSRSASAGAILIEPVQRGWKLYLALADPHKGSLRVNAMEAGPATVLKTGDQLEWGGILLHVTTYQRPYVGPAATDDIGRECPVCSLRIENDIVIFRCATCGTALHWGDGSPGALECARLAVSCPVCDGAITLSEGIVYEPES